ncbi:MAG: MOSC domain-containing protein [Planctomycetia bacterium]|nr:MOSC domain-containing protein [Planctomycetia bacterium]
MQPFQNKSGKIIAISVSKKKGVPKSNVDSAMLIRDFGLEGDAHAGNWHRQVSFLAFESIKKMRDAGLPKIRPGAFAENITTEFIDIPKLKVGNRLQIGNDVELEITQIGKTCHTKCAIYYKVGDCVMPSDGVFAKVINSGKIYLDDNIQIIEA